MSAPQVAVAIICLVGSILLALYVLLLLFVQALRHQLEQLDVRVADLEELLEIEEYGSSLEGRG